jgi:hypothetical protein
MTKYFCDSCGQELIPERCVSRDQQGRLFGRRAIPDGRTMFVQVITGMNETWNHGHYCNACIERCLATALRSQDATVLVPDRIGNPQEA